MQEGTLTALNPCAIRIFSALVTEVTVLLSSFSYYRNLYTHCAYEKGKSRYDTTREAIEGKQAHYEKLGIFIDTLEKHGEPVMDFNAGVWGSMVEYITVDRNKNMTVTFKDGSEVQI